MGEKRELKFFDLGGGVAGGLFVMLMRVCSCSALEMGAVFCEMQQLKSPRFTHHPPTQENKPKGSKKKRKRFQTPPQKLPLLPPHLSISLSKITNTYAPPALLAKTNRPKPHLPRTPHPGPPKRQTALHPNPKPLHSPSPLPHHSRQRQPNHHHYHHRPARTTTRTTTLLPHKPNPPPHPRLPRPLPPHPLPKPPNPPPPPTPQ